MLTNWYIRRSRHRFWDGEHDAIDTLHTVLDVVVRVAAPLLPYVAEEIHGGLHGGRSDGRGRGSVHLRDWPAADELPGDDELVTTMDHVRDVCSATLSVRKAHGRRVRQPLASLTVAVPDADRLAPFVEIIADEVNVRDIALTDDVACRCRPGAAGAPGLDRTAPRPAHPGGHPGRQGGRLAARGRPRGRRWSLAGAGRVHADDGRRRRRGRARRSAAAPASIVLDVDLTPELEQEGRARDVIRLVQQARRDADLAVTDRIDAAVTADQTWVDAVLAHEDLIAGETLAVSITTDATGSDTPEIAVAAAIESPVPPPPREVCRAWPRRRRRPPRRLPAKKAPATTKAVGCDEEGTSKVAAKRPALPRPPPPQGAGEEGAPEQPAKKARLPPHRQRRARTDGIPAPRGKTKDGITYTKDFDVKFLKVQHDRLIAERAALLGQANRLEDEANSLIEDGEMGDVQFDDESGEGDTMVVERERDLALSAQARQTIADIDAALDAPCRGHLRLLRRVGSPDPPRAPRGDPVGDRARRGEGRRHRPPMR